jgi:hypothetical protein
MIWIMISIPQLVGGLEHFSHNIWDTPSHWLICFRGVGQPPTSINVFIVPIWLCIPLMGLFTSINPSYFDVNYRGTIGFDTLPYYHSHYGQWCFFFCGSWWDNPIYVRWLLIIWGLMIRWLMMIALQGTLWLCQNSYWTWSIEIVELPIENGGSFHSFLYVYRRVTYY